MGDSSIAVIGLGPMGHNLTLNINSKGFKVAAFDVDPVKVQKLRETTGDNKISPCESLADLLGNLESPHRVMLMVPAGKPVDDVIESLKPHLFSGDLVIDGGNSHFTDTERRSKAMDTSKILFMGTGVSGGEEGARNGPSIMPGGQYSGWKLVKPIFEAIAAKVEGEPCVAYMGPGGAGHYVKMVHNGIEYGEMQLIAEAYDILRRGLQLSNDEIREVFLEWNRGNLNSYLLEITANIFTSIDPQAGIHLIDLIVDEAQQKGTGKWTSQNSFDLGVPTPTINAAVESRIISALRDQRIHASSILKGSGARIRESKHDLVSLLAGALLAARICAYTQGFALLSASSKEYSYNLNLSDIARIWRGGCIIRSSILNDIRAAFSRNPDLPNLMIDPALSDVINSSQSSLRRVVSLAAENGIPAAAFSSALAYYDAYRSARLPANLLQAQRDYFGAHTYRRLDADGSFHTNW